MRSKSFPYVARPDARVLVLGSLPGAMSLAKQQYYAHPQNKFWHIMGEIAGAFPQLAYEERLEKLTEHRIALWDVCHTAIRPGSLDSAISEEIPNNFAAFFAEHPQVGLICFNGSKAAEIYRRKVLPALSTALQAVPRSTLPSTSPAHAGMRIEQKLERWRAALYDTTITS